MMHDVGMLNIPRSDALVGMGINNYMHGGLHT